MDTGVQGNVGWRVRGNWSPSGHIIGGEFKVPPSVTCEFKFQNKEDQMKDVYRVSEKVRHLMLHGLINGSGYSEYGFIRVEAWGHMV